MEKRSQDSSNPVPVIGYAIPSAISLREIDLIRDSIPESPIYVHTKTKQVAAKAGKTHIVDKVFYIEMIITDQYLAKNIDSPDIVELDYTYIDPLFFLLGGLN